MAKALLLSGGMDSVCLAFWHKPCLAITVDYGQKPAQGEIRAATSVCRAIGIEHKIIRCDLSKLGSGDLAGNISNKFAPNSEWWPYRNQMLVTLGAMECIKRNIGTLEIGCLRTDGAHVDGRPEFISALDALLKMQEGGLRLEAPASHLTAEDLVKESQIPLNILAWSHSCHISDYACGFCRGCQKHRAVMGNLGYFCY